MCNVCKEGGCANCAMMTPDFDPADKRAACIWRARELGAQYELDYVGCAHSSFAATYDALREFGIELFPKEVQDEVFKGLIGLTAGIGGMCEGTCGAVLGSSFAISCATGSGRAESEGDEGRHTWVASQYVKDSVAGKFLEEYKGIVCRDILTSRWGVSFKFRHPGRSKDFFNYTRGESCRTPGECVIARAAGWATEVIWDYLHGVKKDEEAIWQAHKPTVAI